MRLALGIEYNGSAFLGWQRQAEGRTVQATVEKALSFVADHPVDVVCAGRTDSGVHATGQVIHVDTRALRDEKGWLRGTNAKLPADVRVQWVKPVDESFHARFGAVRRHYRYIILNRRMPSALLESRACFEYQPLDVAQMRQAAAGLVGEHDFTSFRAAACQAKSPVRTIYSLELKEGGSFVYIDVVANAFLHHMVRCIAGVLMAVGRGDQPVDWIAELLAAKDRTVSGMNADPGGLYLAGVEYPTVFDIPPRGWLPVYG